MDRVTLKNKAKKDLVALTRKHLLKKFNEVAEEIKNIILDSFDNELSAVSDRSSRTNPAYYRDDFEKRLSRFDFIEDNDSTISLIVPDMENFDFSGKLKIIQTIMEGVVGSYVEVDEDQYKHIFNKRPINEDPLDEYVPPSERIYLVKYLPAVRQAERDLNTKFAKYPFSNKPPVDIMEAAERLVNDNIDRWISDALEEANKELAKSYKGVK